MTKQLIWWAALIALTMPGACKVRKKHASQDPASPNATQAVGPGAEGAITRKNVTSVEPIPELKVVTKKLLDKHLVGQLNLQLPESADYAKFGFCPDQSECEPTQTTESALPDSLFKLPHPTGTTEQQKIKLAVKACARSYSRPKEAEQQGDLCNPSWQYVDLTYTPQDDPETQQTFERYVALVQDIHTHCVSERQEISDAVSDPQWSRQDTSDYTEAERVQMSLYETRAQLPEGPCVNLLVRVSPLDILALTVPTDPTADDKAGENRPAPGSAQEVDPKPAGPMTQPQEVK